jgi:hypothetical protein
MLRAQKARPYGYGLDYCQSHVNLCRYPDLGLSASYWEPEEPEVSEWCSQAPPTPNPLASTIPQGASGPEKQPRVAKSNVLDGLTLT